MFCPQCRTEYREGFTECADCRVSLQSGLPAKPELDAFPTLVGVLDTDDNFALGMATAALREAGILCDVVAIASAAENPGAPRPKWWIRPSRILVATQDANEARSLVEPFQQPLPGEFDTESEPDQS